MVGFAQSYEAQRADFFFRGNVIDFDSRIVESRESFQVTSHSEKDVWDQVREAERRHGDQAEAELVQRILELTATKKFDEASFWAAVAARLKDLHNIKLPDPTVLPTLLNNKGE